MNRGLRAAIFIGLCMLLVGVWVLMYHLNNGQAQLHNQTHSDGPASNACGSFPAEGSNGIGAVLLDGERVGVSDGTVPFYTPNSNYILKCDGTNEFLLCQQAPQSLHCNNAMNAFSQQISQTADDAESLIYRQNVSLQESFSVSKSVNLSHTIIVGISLSSSSENLNNSLYLLQGVYVAQEEYNRTHLNAKLRVLIANFGDSIDTATQTLLQIVDVIEADRKGDNSVVGIVNIPFIATSAADQSLQFRTALQKLAGLNMPVVFPNGASGSESEQVLASTMFHIGVPAVHEGIADAIFARKYLATGSVVVYTDTSDSYSSNLACSFVSQLLQQYFGNCSVPINTLCNQTAYIHCVYYTVNDANSLSASVPEAMGFTPNLIYFAGNASDVKTLMGALRANQQFQQDLGVRILGSDALYQGQFTPVEYAYMDFSAFAFPDEWPDQKLLQNPFVDEYGIDFQGWPPRSGYGFARPNSVATLAYDATDVFTKSIENVSNNGQNPAFIATTVLSAIRQNEFQGFSGYIHFDSQGNPIKKAIVFLIIGDKGIALGKAQMQQMVLGCFLSPAQEPNCLQY